MDRRHAGWKGGMHDGAYYKQAYWFVPEYGEWFLELWYRYLKQVARIDRDHPFAFVNLKREPFGAMYTLTVENAIALCPNCHRERHYGINYASGVIK